MFQCIFFCLPFSLYRLISILSLFYSENEIQVKHKTKQDTEVQALHQTFNLYKFRQIEKNEWCRVSTSRSRHAYCKCRLISILFAKFIQIILHNYNMVT